MIKPIKKCPKNLGGMFEEGRHEENQNSEDHRGVLEGKVGESLFFIGLGEVFKI